MSKVLAIKYRPTNFEELVGQDSITQTLSLALDSNRLSHAYLFSGLRGSGKTSTARIFAKALMCDHGPTSKPCGVCENCVLANESRHIDIIEMDAASNRGIDDIRDLIEHTKYKPAMGRFKIFIIDEVHMLTPQAFNALLKTLEEPPEFVKFILATTDPLKLPATILSRTQHFRFKRIPTSIITEHLKHILGLENIDAEDDALNILARSGNGSLRDTLTMLDQAIIYSKNSIDTKTVTDMLGLVDPRFIENIFNAIFSKNRELVVEYIKELDNYEAELVIDEIIAFLKERLYEQNPQYSTLIIERFFGILSSSKSLFALNANNSFVLSITFFKMLEATKIKDVKELISQLEDELDETITHSVEMQKQEQKQEAVEPLKPEQTETKEVKEIEVQKEQEPLHAKYPQGVEPKVDTNFKKLIDAIKDRSVEYGECFEKHIEFVSYENDVLTWESCVDEECKTKLRHGFGVIKQFVKEIYGYDTKIKSTPCTKEVKKKAEEPLHVEPVIDENLQQSISTAEDVMTDSCVMGCVDNEPVKELDGRTILEDENVKKMIETFEAKKVTVLSKI